MFLKKNYLVLFLMAAWLVSLTGCGAAQDSPPSVEVASQSSPAVPEDIQPDIHTNLPPPGTEAADTFQKEFAENFFEKKEQIEKFSPQLKEAIVKNVDAMPKSDDEAGAPVFFTLMGGTLPTTEDSNCDPSASFLCLDAPRAPEGFDSIYTIHPGVDVIARLDLNNLAVFGPDDPVAVISVFNNDTGGAASEILVMPSDVESTDDPDVGRFQSAVALGGFGKFTIVVSAYRNINDGEANELFSKMVVVYRTGDAEIQFVEAKPVTQGTVGAPVADGDTISSEALQLKVKLVGSYSPGLQVRFENYDEDGRLKGFDAVGHVSPKQAENEGGDIVYTGTVLLHNGINMVRMRAANPQLEAQLGEEAPEPFTITFSVTNYFGRPVIKIISPAPGNPVVAQTAQGQKVQLQFCYTAIPDNIESGGGIGSDPEECVTGSPAPNACLLINGTELSGDELTYNSTDGIYTAMVTPEFGVNLYQINITEDKCSQPKYSQAGSFVYGNPAIFVQDGMIPSETQEDFPTRSLFTQRGIHLDLDRSLVEGDIRDMIQKFVDRPETGDLLLNIFKSKAKKPGYVCDEYIDPNTGKPVQSNGDTSIEFLTDTFSVGPLDGNGPIIELTHLEMSNGMLELGVILHGMHGEADLKPVEPTGNTFNGMDLGFLPITFAIKSLEINVGVDFPLDHKAIDSDGDGIRDTRRLNIRKLPGKDLFKLVGDGPLGKPAYINSNRNPLAAGLELLDWQSNLLGNTFNSILGGTLLCGVEEGMNNANSGTLGRAIVDLQDVMSTNSNLLRFDLDFDLLGKNIKLSLGLDALKGDIVFDSEGIHLRNAPVRLAPGPIQLMKLAGEYAEGIVGPVSRFIPNSEAEPQKNITNDFHKLGLLVGEDTLNQALFAAVGAGLLDLDLDAKFYKNNDIIPNVELAPNGDKLAPGVDINRDGAVNDDDRFTPVKLEIRPDKRTPPMLTFLSSEEVTRFAEEEAAMAETGGDGDGDSVPPGDGDGDSTTPGDGDGDGDTGGPVEIPFFQEGEDYFRIAVSNLQISAYKQEYVPESLGGVRTYCKRTWEDDPSIPAKGFCNLRGDLLFDDNDIPNDSPACEGGELLRMTNDNGATLSHQPVTYENSTEVVPLYRLKINLIAHAKVSGFNREVSAKEVLEAQLKGDPPPKAKTVVHLQFAPADRSPRALIAGVEVVENNTNISDAQIISRFDTILNGALGSACSGLNELRFGIPESLEFDTEAEGLISDLGLAAVDLGSTAEQVPDVFIDENRLYLDLLLYADLQFADEAGAMSIGPVRTN